MRAPDSHPVPSVAFKLFGNQLPPTGAINGAASVLLDVAAKEQLSAALGVGLLDVVQLALRAGAATTVAALALAN